MDITQQEKSYISACDIAIKYKKWLYKNYDRTILNIDNIHSYISEYEVLSNRGLINNDIYTFKTLGELINEVDRINEIKTPTRKEDELDYDIILDDEEILVIKPNSHAASRKLGLTTFKHRFNNKTGIYDSAWCTTYATDTHWNDYYYNQEITFYYCKFKSEDILKRLKIPDNLINFACVVYPDGSIEIYDTNDKLYLKSISFLKYIDIIRFIVPDNILERYDKITKKNISLLNQEVVDSNIYLYPYDYSKVSVKCKIINGDVELRGGQFTEIPHILKDIEINGKFDCSQNILTDLKNAPKKVIDFYCNHNIITSLEGAPQEIIGSFNCNNNKLSTLKYAPKIVGEDFSCSYNRLNDLMGSPKIVLNYCCIGNKLESLKGITKNIKYSIYCSDNYLSNLDHLQNIIYGNLICRSNKLKSLTSLPKEIRGSVFANKNPIKTLKNITSTIIGDLLYDSDKLKDNYIPNHITQITF